MWYVRRRVTAYKLIATGEVVINSYKDATLEESKIEVPKTDVCSNSEDQEQEHKCSKTA